MGALLRFLLPSARLASRLTRDIAIYEKAPDSPEKEEFGRIIASTLGQLNERYAPVFKSRRVAIWKGVGYITLSLVGLAGAAFFIALGFAMDPALAGTTTVVAAIAGAVVTGVASVLIQVSKTREAIETSVRKDYRARGLAAEDYVLRFLTTLGIENIRREDNLRGPDLASDKYVVEVKAPSEQLTDAASIEHALSWSEKAAKRAMVFSATGFRKSAIALADAEGVPLFRFSIDDDVVEGLNEFGKRVIELGPEQALADAQPE